MASDLFTMSILCAYTLEARSDISVLLLQIQDRGDKKSHWLLQYLEMET